MKKTTFLLMLIVMVGCNSHQKKQPLVNIIKDESLKADKVPELIGIDSTKLSINFKPIGNYASLLENISSDKVYFKNAYNINNLKAIDSASKYLSSKLINEIVLHWYGTPWDFNGHTNIPNDGEIACGYFVSTTLKHLGFNLNRYKMAQQAGLIEARMLQPKFELKIYSNLSFQSLKEKVNKAYSDGIYFVGLDNHVGYILIKDSVLYFLHSSYCDDKVVIELAEKSACFVSNIYVFAEITTNKKLVANWITNKRLNVPAN